MNIKLASALIALSSTLVACGGGGSDSVSSNVIRVDDTPTTPVDDTPTDSGSNDGSVGTGGGDSSGGDQGNVGDQGSGGDQGNGGDNTGGDVADPEPIIVPPITVDQVEKTDDLVLGEQIELKPALNVLFRVDLPDAYADSFAFLCASDTTVASPVAVDFSDCIYSGRLSNGNLTVVVETMPTVPYLIGVVLSAGEQDVLAQWGDIPSGGQLIMDESLL